MRGARRFCDEGIVDTMSRSEISVQRSRQAAIRRLAAKVCEKCGLETRSTEESELRVRGDQLEDPVSTE